MIAFSNDRLIRLILLSQTLCSRLRDALKILAAALSKTENLRKKEKYELKYFKGERTWSHETICSAIIYPILGLKLPKHNYVCDVTRHVTSLEANMNDDRSY